MTRVLAAVIHQDGHYLVCQRPAHKRHGGLWEFPGGKIESNETNLDAARRELREELGVNVLEVGTPLFLASDPDSVFVIEFLPAIISGEPQCLEHSALRWVTVSTLLALDLAPADRRFAEFLWATVGRAPAASASNS